MNHKIISFALCYSTSAQQPKKVLSIGHLSSGDSTSESARFEQGRWSI
jgi:hypothetical protein